MAEQYSAGDLIERELQRLQKELGHLEHYTKDIAKAHKAVAVVARANSDMANAFKASTDKIVESSQSTVSELDKRATQAAQDIDEHTRKAKDLLNEAQRLVDQSTQRNKEVLEQVAGLTGILTEGRLPERLADLEQGQQRLNKRSQQLMAVLIITVVLSLASLVVLLVNQ